MKYCIFSAQYLPHMGGVERYTYNLAKNLIKRGNKVTVVTSNLFKMPSRTIEEEIEIYRLPCLNLMNGRYPVLKFDKEFRCLNNRLKQKDFDMVIVNTRFYIHSLYGMVYAKKEQVPCITIEHGTSHLSIHNKVLDKCGAIFEHGLTMIEKNLCHNYYGVSEACNDWLKHFKIKAKGVVYNSIDIEEVEDIYKEAIPFYRQKYAIPDEVTVICFTGRLLNEKGLPSLLNVMDKLNQEKKEVYLFIAGDGDMKEEVYRRRNKYIVPLGQLEYKQVITLLKESDIFCLPSFSEGFSTSILEAVACRCYIITTARGGAKELIVNDEYGSIIPNNKEAILYEAIKEAIVNKKNQKQAIEKSYERLKENFTWNIAAKKIDDIYIKIGEKG